jgi:hypothetical protein
VTNLVLIAIAAFLGAAAACYVFLRPITYSILDPVLVLSVFIACSAPLLAVLCATDLVPWPKFTLFAVVLLAYLAGARTAGAKFSRIGFRQQLADTTWGFSRSEVKAILILTILFTAMLAGLGIVFGAAGDARQQFGRDFRPLILIHGGFFLFSLVLLLSRRFSFSRAMIWVIAAALIAVPFSGKSILVPVIYWIGLRLYVNERRVTLRTIAISASIVVVGVSLMAVVAYGKVSLGEVFFLLGYRLWMSGDTYIYAYQLHGLAGLRGHYNVSFIPYMLHPITALVGIRAYEAPLGAALASQILGKDVLVGPNPHLPVLLDFFFNGSLVASAPIAFIIGYLVLGLRPLGMALQRCRVRFVRLGALVAAIFAPAAGFLDTSQVLISLIGITAVAGTCTLIDLIMRNPLPVPSRDPAR